MYKELLTDYGIDYDQGLKNCMGNPAFYNKILFMFLQDDCFQHAKEAYTVRDYKELFNCMHELKGVSGNAALVALYNSSALMVELLRCGTNSDAEVDRLFAATEEAYRRTREGINIIIA